MRTREIVCEYQPVIMQPPKKTDELYSQSTSKDGSTITHWRDIWIKNVKENRERFGPFSERKIGDIFNEFKYRPVICAGSGPSLKYNVDELKNKGDIPIISCLHNFQFFEGKNIDVAYYTTLDAGEVTVEEVYEGGEHPEEWYWDRTEDKTLLAFVGTSPRLLEKWRGRILFYNAQIPDEEYHKAVDEIEPFHSWVGNGGNVLGACLYISKAYLGAGSIIFVGADFAFGYDRKFHSWDSKYDKKMGYVIPVVDVFGNRVPTWQSYNNFKAWFDWVSLRVPGVYFNCTEGGTLGAYAEGNIHSIKCMDLKDCLDMYHMGDQHVRDQALDPTIPLDDPKGRTMLF